MGRHTLAVGLLTASLGFALAAPATAGDLVVSFSISGNFNFGPLGGNQPFTGTLMVRYSNATGPFAAPNAGPASVVSMKLVGTNKTLSLLSPIVPMLGSAYPGVSGIFPPATAYFVSGRFNLGTALFYDVGSNVVFRAFGPDGSARTAVTNTAFDMAYGFDGFASTSLSGFASIRITAGAEVSRVFTPDPGSTLTVTADSATYAVGDTITIIVTGDSQAQLDLIISGNLGWDPSKVSNTGIASGPFPLTGLEPSLISWTAGGTNGTCGGPLGDNCKVFDYLSGISGPGQTIANSPLLMATLTFSADAAGVAAFDWTLLDFFDQQGTQAGVSVNIVDSKVPALSPGGLALLAALLAGACGWVLTRARQ